MRKSTDIVSSHRLAASALREFLAQHFDTEVGIVTPGEASSATVAVVLGAHEDPGSVPRLVRDLGRGGTRTVLVYDSAAAYRPLLDAASALGVWSTHDIRMSVDVLIDQVRAAQEGRRWSHDRETMQWMEAIKRDDVGLTPRERALVEVLFADEPPSLPSAAERVGMSLNTARVHLANVRRKLGGQHTGNLSALRHALTARGWI